jgi:hypothetical protein
MEASTLRQRARSMPTSGRISVHNNQTGNITASFITQTDCKAWLRAIPEYLRLGFTVWDDLSEVKGTAMEFIK